MNEDLKLMAAGSGVKLWEVAEKMGMADATLSRKLRFEFSPGEREKFLSAVAMLAGERKGGGNG